MELLNKSLRKTLTVFVSVWFMYLVETVRLASAEIAEEEQSHNTLQLAWNIEESNDGRPVRNVESVVVKRDVNLTISCAANIRDFQSEALKVSLVQDDIVHTLAENGMIHSPFLQMSRFRVLFNEYRQNSLTIKIEGVQPEDAGTYICQKSMNPEYITAINVTVLVPVAELFVTSINPDGDEIQVEDEGEVLLQEHDFYGVGCVVFVEGSRIPPEVRLTIDGHDKTDTFEVINEIVSTNLPSGLIQWNTRLRYSFVSTNPNHNFNEKQLKCTAVQNGLPDAVASARLTVQFAPEVQCNPKSFKAQRGTNVTFTCNIVANPGSRITWSSGSGDVSTEANIFFAEEVITSDQSLLSLSIRNVQPGNFQTYNLVAANFIGSGRATFEIVEDDKVPVVERQGTLVVIEAEKETDLSEFSKTSVSEEDALLPEEETTGILSEVNGVLQEVTDGFSQANTTLLKVSSTLPELTSALPELKTTLLQIRSISLKVKSTGAKSTAPPTKGTSSMVKSAKHRHAKVTASEGKSSTFSPVIEIMSPKAEDDNSLEVSSVLPEEPEKAILAVGHYTHSKSSSKKKEGSGKSETDTRDAASPTRNTAKFLTAMLCLIIRWL